MMIQYWTISKCSTTGSVTSLWALLSVCWSVSLNFPKGREVYDRVLGKKRNHDNNDFQLIRERCWRHQNHWGSWRLGCWTCEGTGCLENIAHWSSEQYNCYLCISYVNYKTESAESLFLTLPFLFLSLSLSLYLSLYLSLSLFIFIFFSRSFSLYIYLSIYPSF